jgi:hypothetical protein
VGEVSKDIDLEDGSALAGDKGELARDWAREEMVCKVRRWRGYVSA